MRYPSAVLALLCASPFVAVAAEEPRDPRPDLEAAQAVLDEAVAEVSRPSVHVVLGGREAARGYRLKGVGAIFVLPPRALPNPEHERDRVFVIGDPHGPAAYVRQRSREQELEIRAMQLQVETLQREADAAQREAERALDKFEHNVRVRLVAPGAPPPPESPEPPAAPAPELAQSGPMLAPPPPPWRFWFEAQEATDDRTPERVVADVQAAVTSALERLGPRLPTVPADEAVLVAVDFLPSRGFEFDLPAAPTRSLVVKARKRDLVDRSAGKISAEELRRRIEYTQY